MRRHLPIVPSALLLPLLLAGSAAAQPAPALPGMRALVVGSNRGGPGQEDLRYAEDDAERFAALLVEMGGYPQGSVRVLRGPDREALLVALDEARDQLTADQGAGTSTVFSFFYSGHARAGALALGASELSLPELRQELLSLPATVTLAILDACQTGAISHIKGAAPAADFSFNSVRSLNSAGAAIMASSSGSELSQESDRLGSSYFTHHLIVGLRGAADADSDGRVTLSEAYRYAYSRTLLATASTAVGRQHVTLENDLRGKGEMVITYPARASAQLEVPGALQAEITVERSPGGAVVAEVTKAAGDAMRIGLPPGHYAAVVNSGRKVRRCEVALAAGEVTELAVTACPEAPVERATAKDYDARTRTAWGIEVGFGSMSPRTDGYNHRLEQFGFDGTPPLWALAGHVALTRSLGRYLKLVARVDSLEFSSARRDVNTTSDGSRTQTFDWQTLGVGLFLRAGLPLAHGVVTPYLQGGGGLSLGFTGYGDGSRKSDDHQVFAGYELGALAGIEFMPWVHFGFFTQLGYTYAPTIRNLIGDTHDAGGWTVSLVGLRGAW